MTRWARDLLTGQVMNLVLMEGEEPEMTPEVQDENISPEGWKGDEPEEVRRARTTGGTLHLRSQEVKETLPEGRKSEGDQEPKDDWKSSPVGWKGRERFLNKVKRP